MADIVGTCTTHPGITSHIRWCWAFRSSAGDQSTAHLLLQLLHTGQHCHLHRMFPRQQQQLNLSLKACSSAQVCLERGAA